MKINGEGGADARLAGFDVDASAVVFADDATRQGETKPPPSLFGGEAGAKNGFEMFAGNSLSRVSELNVSTRRDSTETNRDAALTVHGIHGVAAEIFNDPLKQRSIDANGKGMGRRNDGDADFLGGAAIHVVRHSGHHGTKVLNGELRCGTYLGKTFGNELKTLHVVGHLRQKFILGIGFAKHLYPSHDGRNGSAKLVSGLARQTHPNSILLRTLESHQSHEGDDHKNKNDGKLDVREKRKTVKQHGFLIVHTKRIVRDFHLHAVAFLTNALQLGTKNLKRITPLRRIGKIPPSEHIILRISDDDGDGVIAVDDFQHKIQVGRLICHRQRAHGFSPHFHLGNFLRIEVADERVGIDERSAGNDDGTANEEYLQFPDSF